MNVVKEKRIGKKKLAKLVKISKSVQNHVRNSEKIGKISKCPQK